MGLIPAIQLILPLFLLVLPLLYWLYCISCPILFAECVLLSSARMVAAMPSVLLLLYPPLNSVLTLVFVSPYRRAGRRMLFCGYGEKKVGINHVSPRPGTASATQQHMSAVHLRIHTRWGEIG